ncbi:MAG TPA: HD domain-containing phosphohydrolase [Gallionella sp.]|nr:HD domain-containing phosphohydrolase [Gallionella sp.]
MDQPVEELRVLMLEDVTSDAELEESELLDAGLAFTSLRVDTRDAFEQALDEFKPDIILADYRLPAYSGRDALAYARRTHPQIPVIMVTGVLGDEAAVELLKLGARDYVLKDRLVRLPLAIKRALSEERGIRNRKLAEGKFRILFTEALDGIVIADQKTERVIDCNPEFERMCGRTLAELKALRMYELAPMDQSEAARKKFLEIMKTGSSKGEFDLRKPDGTIVPIEFSSALINIQDQFIIQTITRDIAERKLAEEALRRINRTLHTLSAGNVALVKAVDEAALLDEACRVIVDIGEYSMVWVGYARDDEPKSLLPMACRGVEKSELAALKLTWADAAGGQCALARAIRSGKTQISRNIQGDPDFEFYHELAIAQGWSTNLAVPLSDGRIFGGLSIFTADPNAFDADEVALLNELGGDLAYGINALRTRAERDQAAEKNRLYLDQISSNLKETIQAIAATVEMRDPYISGHEKRVAKLAVAIAQEMGLAREQTEALEIAADVHDIGKIRVPTEILSKPGALDGIEHDLIKLHAQAGYEILKGIKFPWPVADIVLQHHERLDGSGYPGRLKGSEILLDAQILSVADVVESIMSHRPYRPAFDVDVALKDILEHRGKLYNADAVDACTRLFREKGFAFS